MRFPCSKKIKRLRYNNDFRHYLLLSLLLFFPLPRVASQDYFQQEVNYYIQVSLNDRKHELSGFERVEYINNSPDSLSFLYFHLWPNAYSDNSTSLARELFNRDGKAKLFNDPELKGYIDSLDFAVDGIRAEWNLIAGAPDICRIELSKPLKHGDTISITTPFHVKIPKGVTSRLGHIGESYQISQWYPKPAVYDNTGWHQMPYLDQGEFYSEYGSFDVSITLPVNYTVASSGNLQNVEELKRLDSLAGDISWMKTLELGGTDFPPSSIKMKTLRYTEEMVHDFAWFADKRFHVLKGRAMLPGSGREVTTWAMFTNQESLYWINAISYINNAIRDFSEWIGDYPYNNFTAVQSALNSGSGMEYPGLTVVGLANDPYLLDEVIAHEISHSWFYSALGSDERRFPYMDESFASAYESRYLKKRYPEKKLWEIGFKNIKLARFFNITDMPVQRMQEMEWLIPARRNSEIPGNLSAAEYRNDNYGSIVYFKAAQGINYLRAYLGDSVFDTIMHDYYQTWRNRHPGPGDLRMVFESNTDKDLSWFFDDFLGTTKRLDYKVARQKDQMLLIKNKGELISPVLITGMTGDSPISEKWEDGFKGKKWIKGTWGNNSEIRIDHGHVMTELYRLNNNIRTSGIFRKADPFQLQLLYTIEDPDKRSLLFIPAVDWNSADGFLAGVALHNGRLIPKPVEYFFIPLYKLRDPGIAGYGRIAFNFTPYENLIRLATFLVEGEKFGAPGDQDYNRARIGLELNFRLGKLLYPLNHKAFGYYVAASDLAMINQSGKAGMRSYFQFGYIVETSRIINPYNLSAVFESGKSFQKTSLEYNYKYSYYGRNNGLEIRLFTGVMLKNSSDDPFYGFSTAGRSGREQYLFQGLYPDRFTRFPQTFWSRQMTISEGGLATPVADTIGYSRWLCSLSFTSSLPEKVSWVPFRPFVNLLLNDQGVVNGKSPLFFEAGFKAGIWNFFEVYIPLIVSDNIGSISGSFKDRIRFTFNLNLFNPVKFF